MRLQAKPKGTPVTIQARDKTRSTANKCDGCGTHFDSARHLVTHLYYVPSHVKSAPLSGARADAQYRSVGR